MSQAQGGEEAPLVKNKKKILALGTGTESLLKTKKIEKWLGVPTTCDGGGACLVGND